MQVQGAFNLLFRPGLRKDFRDEYNKFETEYNKYLKVSTTSLPEQSATIMTGMNRLIELGDGEGITYQDLVLGPKVMGVDKEFGVGCRLTRRAVEDDQYGKLKGAAKYLAEAARLTYEYRGAQLLDDAFTGSTFKGIDNLSLINNAHTFLNAPGTWSNTPATQIELSVAGITALDDIFMTMKNHNADPIRMMGNLLIIGNESGMSQRAWQIFRSEKEPFTAENQDNALKNKYGNMDVQVSRYKTSRKSYFMVDKTWNDAHFVVRRPVRAEDDYDFNTSAALYKITTRFLVWFVDPRGWAGVNPA